MKSNADLMLYSAWINGKEQTGTDAFTVSNPANGKVLASVAESDCAMAELAIAAANDAFYTWKSTAARERARIIESWAALIEKHQGELATILCSENGKVLSEAKGEISHSVSSLRWCAQSLLRVHGETLPIHSSSQRNYTIKQAVGVVACITPWNFPAAAILVKVGAAIAAGCTAVVKPAEETPLIALALAKLSGAAGMPAGVLNVLPCSDPKAVGDTFCQHPDVKMLSFTGSTSVGSELYAACGRTLKRVAMELGGNAPFIVFDDADIDKAIEGALSARYYNAGQICVGANRFFIHESIYPDFAEKLAKRVSALVVGDGFDEKSQIGPLINRAAKTRLNALIDDALSKGAQRLIKQSATSDSLFFTPTVLTGMQANMQAHDSEVFGPVACLYSFKEEPEVVQLANDTPAGLAAYIYSRDIAKLIRVSEALDAGVIGANSTHIFSNDLPFGGVKQSGLGREHGLNFLEEFMETKSICLELH